MVSAGDFKNGLTIQMDNNIWQIIEFQHVKPGKGAAFVRTKLKNIVSGGVVEKSFRPTEKFDLAHIEKREYQYLYSDGDLYNFMDTETFEPAFDCQDAFQAHNAACPAPSIDFIDVTTVVRLPTSEGCAGGQARPSTHYALTGRQLISWQFDPLVFKQTLHCADLLPDRLKKATLRATLINTEARLTKNVIYL